MLIFFISHILIFFLNKCLKTLKLCLCFQKIHCSSHSLKIIWIFCPVFLQCPSKLTTFLLTGIAMKECLTLTEFCTEVGRCVPSVATTRSKCGQWTISDLCNALHQCTEPVWPKSEGYVSLRELYLLKNLQPHDLEIEDQILFTYSWSVFLGCVQKGNINIIFCLYKNWNSRFGYRSHCCHTNM